MFEDDITISGSPLVDLEQKTNSELLNLHCWLKANRLSLNVAKTEFMVIGSRQKLLAESHNDINIKLEDQVISKVDHAKLLGLITDNRLSWSNHVNQGGLATAFDLAAFRLSMIAPVKKSVNHLRTVASMRITGCE